MSCNKYLRWAEEEGEGEMKTKQKYRNKCGEEHRHWGRIHLQKVGELTKYSKLHCEQRKCELNFDQHSVTHPQVSLT